MARTARIDPQTILAIFDYDPVTGALHPKPGMEHMARKTDKRQWEVGAHRYSLHRLVWAWHHPDNPNPKFVTFRDGVGTTTRIENLHGTNEHPRWAGHVKQRRGTLDEMGRVLIDGDYEYNYQ